MPAPHTVYREGDRIRATDGQGYHDCVTDEDIIGHLGHDGPQGTSQDAFARAVLAIRAYERAVIDERLSGVRS